MNKKIKSIVSLILIIMLLITGCGGNSNESKVSSGSEGGNSKDSINFGLTSDPVSLDPVMTTDQMSKIIFNQIYNTLIVREKDGSYGPGLAEKWAFSDDGKELTLNLKKDVKFHNGDIMTADDVVFSLDRAAASKSTKKTMVSYDHSEAIDDNTVKIYYANAYGAALDCLISINICVVNKRAVEENGEEAFAQNPVGTGPYKFVERKSGEKIILERYDDYFKGPAAIKNVTFKIITDSSTAVVALEKGELDILSHAPLTDKQHLIENENITWYETEIAGLVYVIFNNTNGKFADKKLRQAVQYAIDKEAQVIGSVEGYGTPVATAIPKAAFGYPEDFEDIPYDLEKAKQLMAEAGFPDGFNVEIKTQETPTYYKPAEVLQGQLDAIGIKAEITKMERGALFEDLFDNHTYEISIMNWTTPVPDADYLYGLYHSSQIKDGQNFVETNNAELDKLLEDGRVELDPEKRKGIYYKACEIMRDEAMIVPLFSFMAAVAANKDLKGVRPDPLYSFFIYDYSW